MKNYEPFPFNHETWGREGEAEFRVPEIDGVIPAGNLTPEQLEADWKRFADLLGEYNKRCQEIWEREHPELKDFGRIV